MERGLSGDSEETGESRGERGERREERGEVKQERGERGDNFILIELILFFFG